MPLTLNALSFRALAFLARGICCFLSSIPRRHASVAPCSYAPGSSPAGATECSPARQRGPRRARIWRAGVAVPGRQGRLTGSPDPVGNVSGSWAGRPTNPLLGRCPTSAKIGQLWGTVEKRTRKWATSHACKPRRRNNLYPIVIPSDARPSGARKREPRDLHSFFSSTRCVAMGGF